VPPVLSGGGSRARAGSCGCLRTETAISTGPPKMEGGLIVLQAGTLIPSPDFSCTRTDRAKLPDRSGFGQRRYSFGRTSSWKGA
jgi:hypothetical protein